MRPSVTVPGYGPLSYLDSLYRGGEYDTARLVARQLIAETPSCMEAYRIWIAIEEKNHDISTALFLYPKLVALSKDRTDIVRWYRHLYGYKEYETLLSHFATLWPHLQSILQYPTTAAQLWIFALRATLQSNMLTTYETYAVHLPLLKGRIPMYYQCQGVYHILIQKSADATAILEEGARLFPDIVALHVLLGCCYYAQNQMDCAQAPFLKALHLGSAVALQYLLEICPEKNEVNQILKLLPPSILAPKK